MTAPTPDAVAQAREQEALGQLLDAANAKRDEDFAMGVYVAGTAYAKAVEARVRAECADRVREHKMPTGAVVDVATASRNRAVNEALDDVLAALEAKP